MATEREACRIKPRKKSENKRSKKQITKPPYPSMDEQVREFAEIIVAHLLNNHSYGCKK